MRQVILLLVFLISAIPALPARADDARLDELFAALLEAGPDDWLGIEEEIWGEWGQSGSPAMDLLLERGRAKMRAGDLIAAISDFSVLIENAPDFAEGWNARATAYFMADLYGPSVSDIAHVLALEPRHFGALAGLGAVLEEGGNLKDAKGAYEAALAIHPQRPDLREAVQRLEAALQGSTI
jgi:tetratricopeptide (TPR) repeat protein